VITTDTQVLRCDGLDVVALPQTWGRLPPYLRGPRRTATEPDVFGRKNTHMTDDLDARVAERPLHEADERVVVLARALDFGFRLHEHSHDAISPSARPEAALGCGVWCRKDRADGGR
jgi:hypothetical protein